MDTRQKIVTAAAAAETVRQKREQGSPVRLVTGYFDPLLAAHSKQLQDAAPRGGTLVVAIREPGAPLLPAAARAELVSALRVVDYVVLATADEFQQLERVFSPGEIFRQEAADETLSREFVAHVRSRH